MCPTTTDLNYVWKHTQCCLNEAALKTVDEDSTIPKVMKGLFETQWSYKVMVDLGYPQATTRDSKREQSSNTMRRTR